MTSHSVSLVLALLAGIAIAAASGLRAFLPLLGLGLAARFAGLELHPGMRWLTSDVALIALATATLIEIAGDKIPVVDHALDAVATVVRPATAALATYGLLAHWPTPWAQILAVLLGGTALALHVVKAKTRLGSTALSLGFANPILSTIEDVVSITFVVIAFLAPVVVALLVLLLVLLLTRRHSVRAVAVAE